MEKQTQLPVDQKIMEETETSDITPISDQDILNIVSKLKIDKKVNILLKHDHSTNILGALGSW